MRVLVTGATGRVGRAIAIHLMRAGHDVTGFDRAPSSTAAIVADLDDDAALARALDGVDAIVHTAGLHAPQVDVVPDAEFERINVGATRRLLARARDAGIGRFVLTSTTALYGVAGWIDESVAPQPRTIYHRTKLAAEDAVREAAAAGGLAATILRMSRCFPEPVPEMAAYRLHRGVDARDVASAHAFALADETPGCRVFVVSGATPFERADIDALAIDAPAVLARRAPGLVETFTRRGWPLPRIIDRVYSPGALQALGWSPRRGYDEVIRQYDDESGEVLPP